MRKKIEIDREEEIVWEKVYNGILNQPIPQNKFYPQIQMLNISKLFKSRVIMLTLTLALLGLIAVPGVRAGLADIFFNQLRCTLGSCVGEIQATNFYGERVTLGIVEIPPLRDQDEYLERYALINLQQVGQLPAESEIANGATRLPENAESNLAYENDGDKLYFFKKSNLFILQTADENLYRWSELNTVEYDVQMIEEQYNKAKQKIASGEFVELTSSPFIKCSGERVEIEDSVKCEMHDGNISYNFPDGSYRATSADGSLLVESYSRTYLPIE